MDCYKPPQSKANGISTLIHFYYIVISVSLHHYFVRMLQTNEA